MKCAKSSFHHEIQKEYVVCLFHQSWTIFLSFWLNNIIWENWCIKHIETTCFFIFEYAHSIEHNTTLQMRYSFVYIKDDDLEKNFFLLSPFICFGEFKWKQIICLLFMQIIAWFEPGTGRERVGRVLAFRLI